MTKEEYKKLYGIDMPDILPAQEEINTTADEAIATADRNIAAVNADIARDEKIQQAQANKAEASAAESPSPVQQVEQNYDRSINDMIGQLQSYKNEANAAIQENQQQVEQAQQKAAWTGATEFANALTNLIGVAAGGASSQTYKPYSQDWMRIAEEQKKAKQVRTDNLRERQRVMEAQLSTLRTQKGNALVSAQNQAEANAIRRETLAAQREQKAASVALAQARARKTELEVQLKAAEKNKKVAEADRIRAQIRKIDSDIQVNAARAGLYNAEAGYYNRRNPSSNPATTTEQPLP